MAEGDHSSTFTLGEKQAMYAFTCRGRIEYIHTTPSLFLHYLDSTVNRSQSLHHTPLTDGFYLIPQHLIAIQPSSVPPQPEAPPAIIPLHQRGGASASASLSHTGPADFINRGLGRNPVTSSKVSIRIGDPDGKLM